MPLKPTQHAHSETYREILSQGEVWQAVLQELEQSKPVERMLGGKDRKPSWLFVGCGTISISRNLLHFRGRYSLE